MSLQRTRRIPTKIFPSHSGVRAKRETPSYSRAALIFARPSASVPELAADLNRAARLRIRIPNRSMPRPHADPARHRSVGMALCSSALLEGCPSSAEMDPKISKYR